jgi:hypothetical protein
MDRIVSVRWLRPARAALVVALAAVVGPPIFGAAAAQEKKEPAKEESSPSPTNPPKSASASATSPTAAEVLAFAIAAQGRPAGAPASGPLPLALHAKANLQFETAEGHRISIDAERRFLAPKDGPRMVWTRAVSTFDKKETQMGFDGRKPWFWSKESGVRWLTEPGTENDRANVEEDLETSELLARSFLLENLKSELKELRRLDDVARDGLTAWVVEGDAEVDRNEVNGANGAKTKRKLKLRLYVEQKSHFVFGARVAVEGETALQICFTQHEKSNGVVVPGKIEIYRGDDPKPWQTLRVSELDLAPKLTAKDFEAPAAK